MCASILLSISSINTVFAKDNNIESNKATLATYKDTYNIYSASDLIEVANKVNSGDDLRECEVCLMNDISFKGLEFIPIGDAMNPFNGIFNGNGHSIDYMVVNLYDYYCSYVGLFGNVGNYGIVKNVTVGGHCKFEGTNFVGGIAGSNSGIIFHCCSRADLSSEYANVGGISGYNDINGYIANCRLSYWANISCSSEISTPENEFVGTDLGVMINCETFKLYPW